MMIQEYDIRGAFASELDSLAQLWFDAWQDAHAEVVPAEVVRARTLASFRARLLAMLQDLRVVGPLGRASGFYFVKADELEQLFVGAASRGTGVAAALVAAAERQLQESGIRTAWLACAIGNHRAARFYEKCGWTRAGIMTNRLDLAGRAYALEVWRYEKMLAPHRAL